jgi:hypothetical protein
MQAFLETTEWQDTEFNCNHVYWMDNAKNKIHAYARFGNPRDVQVFKNPITIDIRGRKFEPVRHDIFGWTDAKESAPVANPAWTVTGSRGDNYTVELIEGVYTCSCSGFKFRGNCKHATEVENEQTK